MNDNASRSPSAGFRLALLTAVLAACAPAPRQGTPTPAAIPSTAAAGIYTEAQADLGQTVFNANCTTCHNARQFTGQMFAITWMNEPVGGLYQFIRNAMPQNDPGSLEDEEYAAIVAYVLRNNGRPAGEIALPADGELLGGVSW